MKIENQLSIFIFHFFKLKKKNEHIFLLFIIQLPEKNEWP